MANVLKSSEAQDGLSSLGVNGSADSNRKFYDGWASTYKKDVASWGYDAPEQVANTVKEYIDTAKIATTAVLDAGAGTGLSGEALKKSGFGNIFGIDVSPEMVAIGKTKDCYKDMEVVDLTKPMTYPNNEFDVVVCVGTTTYLNVEVLSEFIRVTKPGGLVCCTFRTDIVDKWHIEHEKLVKDGKWETIKITDPIPYLPNNPEYGSKIKVVIYLWRICTSATTTTTSITTATVSAVDGPVAKKQKLNKI